MRVSILMLLAAFALAGCSGAQKQDSYLNRNGVETPVISERDQCMRACNANYARCGDSDAARRSGVDAPDGLFGGRADCNSSLSHCLVTCKGR